MHYTNEQISKMLDDIFNGIITVHDLPVDYYNAITSYLASGLYKGFGMNLEQAPEKDTELLTKLRENVYMFGAAKTYQQTKEISGLLVDDDGNVRTQKEFADVAKQTYSKWNDDWGKSEYNTAIGQAQAASKWDNIIKNKSILPNLRYSAIGDACFICQPLDGLTAKVDDPIWSTITPLNHFNCMCILEQLDDEDAVLTSDDEKDTLYDQQIAKMDPVFQSNPGMDGMIFNKHHPYFDVAKEDKAFAKRNFDLPIPNKDE